MEISKLKKIIYNVVREAIRDELQNKKTETIAESKPVKNNQYRKQMGDFSKENQQKKEIRDKIKNKLFNNNKGGFSKMLEQTMNGMSEDEIISENEDLDVKSVLDSNSRVPQKLNKVFNRDYGALMNKIKEKKNFRP